MVKPSVKTVYVKPSPVATIEDEKVMSYRE